jgi:predicted nucleotidyltransferase
MPSLDSAHRDVVQEAERHTPGRRGLGDTLYLAAARASAAVLGRREIVDQILVHRSVATGDVDFGRSDIDLVLIVRPDPDGGRHGVQMLELCRSVRRIRRINRALGHVEAHDRPGWEDWQSIDTYRGSQERRSAITLSGRATVLPMLPVRREHAIRRFVLMPLHHLVDVLLRDDRRNLLKIAREMWSAYAVATGSLSEPFLRRDEIAAHYERSPERPALGPLGGSPESLTLFMWRLSRLLHDRVLDPLEVRRLPPSLTLRLPPYEGTRRFILPTASHTKPLRAESNSTILSPEALDLFVHFVNPFVWHGLPSELLDSGFRQPPAEAYVEASRFQFRRQVLRAPGVMSANTDLAIAWDRLVAGVLPHLEQREPPPETAMALYAGPSRPTLQEYYGEHFPRLCRSHDKVTDRLRNLPGFQPRGSAS